MATNIPPIPQYTDEQDYGKILSNYLGNVRDDVDKREGSIIFDAGAPCCFELAKYYVYLNAMILNMFASTAEAPYIDLKCEELNIYRKLANKAKRLGKFYGENETPFFLGMGVRFSSIDSKSPVNYIITEVHLDSNGQAIPGEYVLECENSGSVGNEYYGSIVPITNINGLVEATLSDVLVPGTDDEETESLRKKYFERINTKPFGGNLADYRNFVTEIEGVGSCQIYPAWKGGGTVLISILDSNFDEPSEYLISTVQNLVDPYVNDKDYAGEGLGQAPIDHRVTIKGASNFEISVSAKVDLSQGVTLPQVKTLVEESIENYFKQIRQDWGKSDNKNRYKSSVFISRIGSAILSVSGVENVTNILLNNSSSDIQLIEDKDFQQIPKLLEVILDEQ